MVAISTAPAFATSLSGVRAGAQIATFDGPPPRIHESVNDRDSVSAMLSFNDTGANPSTGRDFQVTSSSNLATGELRGMLQGQGGPAGGVSNSVLGQIAEFIDTIVVPGGSGQSFDAMASLGGVWSVTGPPLFGAGLPNGSRVTTTLRVFAGEPFADFDRAAIFDPSVDTILEQTRTGDVNSTYPLDLAGSFTLPSGVDRFQFVYGMELLASSSDSNTHFTADFSQTGRLRFDFHGHEAFSASGVFPGTTPVPEPAAFAWLSMILAANAVRCRAVWR